MEPRGWGEATHRQRPGGGKVWELSRGSWVGAVQQHSVLPRHRCERVQSLPWPLRARHLPQHHGQLSLLLCGGLYPGCPGKELHRYVPTSASGGSICRKGGHESDLESRHVCLGTSHHACLTIVLPRVGYHPLWASETLAKKQEAGKGDPQGPPGWVEISALIWYAVAAPCFPRSVRFGSLGFLGSPVCL